MSSKRSNSPVAASSATYRSATNRVAKKLRVKAVHTRKPSEDFKLITEQIDEVSQQRALEWYRRGLRRGFEHACDQFIDKKLELKNGKLYCPPAIKISVTVRFRSEQPKKKEFKFKAEEFGFE